MTINQDEFNELVQMTAILIRTQKIDRKIAEMTLERIARRYELQQIYLW